MSRSVKLLTPFATLLAVLGIGYVHAHFIGHYQLTLSPKPGQTNPETLRWLLILIVLVWITTYAAGVNEPGIRGGQRLVRSAAGVGSAIVIVSLIQLVATRGGNFLPRVDTGGSVIVLVPLLAVLGGLADRSLAARGLQERVIALVNTDERDRLVADMKRDQEQPSQLVLAVEPSEVLPKPDQPAPLRDLVKEQRATLIVLNREAQSLDEIVSQAAEVHSQGVRVRTLSLFYDEWLGKLPLSELERIALLFDINEIHRPVYARLERYIDIALSLPGFLGFLIAIPFVAFANLFGNRGPLFYHQDRVGKDGKVFRIHKFRTMRPASDASAPTHWTAENDPRLGRVGRMLRRLHVDELPQVVNVLNRDMSIVGPRPEQPHYVAKLRETIPFYDVRHLVRPGITGWAQVKYDYGSTEIDAWEKLQYEFYYLRHQDLTLDLRIIGRTLRSVTGGEGR